MVQYRVVSNVIHPELKKVVLVYNSEVMPISIELIKGMYRVKAFIGDAIFDEPYCDREVAKAVAASLILAYLDSILD